MGVALRAGVTGLVVGSVAGVSAARLRRHAVRVAYTRKVFHFLVFTGAALVHTLWGLPGTNTYGVVIAALVLSAVHRREDSPLYVALARDKDRPRRSLFIVVPLVMTAIGGLVSALLAGPFASVGYLVAGWGDAVGEPVGSRWGRHPYRVPSLAGVPAERTLEGTVAVFGVSWIAAVVALWSLGTGPGLAAASLACALVGAGVEAFSNHGLDNLTVQVSVSLTAVWLGG